MRARELGRKSVVVGDRVGLVGDISGAAGRTGPDRPDRRAHARCCAAPPTTTRPPPRAGSNGSSWPTPTSWSSSARWPTRRRAPGSSTAAWWPRTTPDIEPLLCLTKADLAGPEEVLGYYAELELPYVLVRPDTDLTSCAPLLRGRVSVLVGHSGVGKSTLVNRAGAGRRPGGRRGQRDRPGPAHLDQRGGAARCRAPGADGTRAGSSTPRDPQLRAGARVGRTSLLHGFPDLVEGTVDCPPNCQHTADEADCALDAWVAAGKADPRRLASYRRLLASRAGEGDSRGDRATERGPGGVTGAAPTSESAGVG